MERILESQAKEVASGRTGLEQDAEFHAAIGAAAHNRAITRIAHAVMDLLRQSREESLNTPGRPDRSHNDHRRVLAAIRNRDETAARQAMIEDEPPALPDARQHASLGGVGEHLARRWGLTIPRWTDHPSRFLHEPYFTTPIEDLKAMLLVQSPLAFRRRLIFTEAEPLRRARMPRPAAPAR